MAERIKKGFFRILPWSVAVFMIFALAVGIWTNLPTNLAKAADDSITLNANNFTLQTDADTNNYANIGDTVRINVDLSNIDGGCVAAGTTVTVDLTAYGGTASESLTCITDTGGLHDIFQLDFPVVDAGVSGIDVGANNPASAVTVTASDADENNGTGAPNPTLASNNLGAAPDVTATNGVDTIAPALATSGLLISTDNGVGGVAAVNGGLVAPDQVNVNATVGAADGDIITWNASPLGGGASATQPNNTPVTVAAGAVDNAAYAFSVTATDNAGNSVTQTTSAIDGLTISLDNILPTVFDTNIYFVSAGSGPGGAYNRADTAVVYWDSSVTGDNNGAEVASASMDFSNLGGGAAVAMEDDGAGGACDDGGAGDFVYCAAYVVNTGAATDTIDTVSVTATDNAGNTTTAIDSGAVTVDNIAPVVTAANVTVTGCMGLSGICKFGDTPTLNWLGNTDGETDTIASVTFDGSNFRTGDNALATPDPGTPGTNNWSRGLSGAMDLVDAIGNTIDVTVVDDVGNSTGPITSAVGYKIDTIVPTLTNVQEFDVNHDGKIDETLLTFDDNIVDATVNPADFTIGGIAADTVMAGAATNGVDTNTADDNQITIEVAAGVTGTEAKAVHYTAGSLTDDAGNSLATVTFVAGSVTDSAAPVYVSSVYKDINGDGQIDRVDVTFSENITLTAYADADWTIFAGYVNLGNETAASVQGGNGTSAILNISTTGDPHTTGGAPSSTVAYTNNSNNLNDGLGNNTATFGAQTISDGAAPVPVTATFYDATGSDGKLDLITTVWSEGLSAVADGHLDWALSGSNFAGIVEGTVECNHGAATATKCNYNFTTTTVKTDVGNLSLAYTGASVTDGTNPAAHITITSASTPAFTDGADPVIVTTSPADGATGVDVAANPVVTFSEPMTTGSVTYTLLPNPGGLGVVWSGGNTVATYSHTAFNTLTLYTFTVTAGDSFAAGDGSLATGPVVNPFTFTTLGGGGGGGGGGASLPPTMTVTKPNGGETLTGGGTYEIDWSFTGTGTVDLYYSLDGGINFPYTIATGETNDGKYTWTVPNIATGTAKVKAVSSSLNDISDSNFTITHTTSLVSAANSTIVAAPTSVEANGTSFSTVTVTVKDATSVPLAGQNVTLTSSRGSSDTITTLTGTTGADGKATFNVYSSTAGTSTYTAMAAGTVLTSTAAVVFTAPGEVVPPTEVPTGLNVGDLIKSSLSSSVYYYGSDNKRHLFPNETTYKSWYPGWSGVKTIPATELQGISLGHNVTIRPGTVLVKIQTDPKVYAVEPNGLLRWVPTEARAAALYGSAWATKIVDVPLIFWVDYSFGSDITTDAHPTGTLVKYSGTTSVYYIQGSEKRYVSSPGFIANNFQNAYVLTIPATISYANGADITGAEDAVKMIY